MSLINRWNTAEFANQRYETYNMEWTDLEDFWKKYNIRDTPEIMASWNTFGRSILGLAELRNKGLIDIIFLDGMMLSDIRRWWVYFGALEKEAWEKGQPNWWSVVPFVAEVIDYDRRNPQESKF